ERVAGDVAPRDVEWAAPRKARGYLLDPRANHRIAPVEPRDADLDRLERLDASRLEPWDERRHHRRAIGDAACNRASVVEGGRERETAIERHEPVRRLEADHTA